MASVSAILLAAGESTRMGQQKALIPWQGATLLEYQLAQLEAVDSITETIVVTGHDPARITEIVARTENARVAHNAGYRAGKVSSIQCALAAVSPDADAILLLAIDQPRPASVVRAVVDAYTATGSAIVLPANGGRRGHPVLFARQLFAEIAAIREDTRGVRAVIDRHADRTFVVELGDPSVNLDLNTPADLDAASISGDS